MVLLLSVPGQGRRTVKLLLPDTNFWIDAKRPIDFRGIVRGDSFVVVVPRKVLSELDKHVHEVEVRQPP